MDQIPSIVGVRNRGYLRCPGSHVTPTYSHSNSQDNSVRPDEQTPSVRLDPRACRGMATDAAGDPGCRDNLPGTRKTTSEDTKFSGKSNPEMEERDRMSMISTEGVTVEYLCFRCGRQGIMVVNPPTTSSMRAIPSSEVTCPGCGTTVVGRPVMESTASR